MKNLYSKSEFLQILDNQIINEGLISKIFKGLWQSVVKLSKKIKGSNEINAAYDKYKKMVDDAFNKMQNVETARTATGEPQKPEANTPVNAGFEHDNDNKLYEAPVADPTKITNPEEDKQKQQQQQNKQDTKNLVNLKPDQIKTLSEQTKKRIEQLQTQFDTDVNNIIIRLSKNPDYSSDKLKQFAVVMKNQLNSYVYDQWYSFYTKIGDQKKILEVTKIKKQNEATFKQSIQDLNTKLGEKQQQLQAGKGGQYIYYSNDNKADITVQIIGDELGKDENGNPDTANPDHNNMWKVMNPKTKNTFWVAPNAFKKVVKQPEKTNTTITPKAGENYKYNGKDVKIIGFKNDRGEKVAKGNVFVLFTKSNNKMSVSIDQLQKK